MQDDLVRAFESALPASTVFSGDAIEPKYWHDWSGLPPVQPRVLLRPRSTQEVATAMQLCNRLLDLIAENAESSRDEMLTRIARHIQETCG